jgi:Mn2+/Fe2+ NRAMP family transporter
MTKQTTYLRKIWRNLGPGLLFASTAIGTSHLVLSTRAGAELGWTVAVVIIMANVFKYPFFEFAIRYTGATQRSLLEGYLKRGRWILIGYLFLNLLTLFVIVAALAVVTAGLFGNLFHISPEHMPYLAGGLLGSIAIVLILGRYRFLVLSLKYVVSILFMAVLTAFAAAAYYGMATPEPNFIAPALFDSKHIVLLVMLVGWMPTALEASSWPSMWAMSRLEETGQPIHIRDSLQEFNLSYIITAVLALVFMGLGVLGLYGTGTEISSKPVVFAGQLMRLFTDTLGDWSYIVVAVAAALTMFSTLFTAQDAASRVSTENVRLLFNRKLTAEKVKHIYTLFVLLTVALAFALIWWFSSNLGFLVQLATSLSFMLAPIIALLNLKTIQGKEVNAMHKPKGWLLYLSYAGLLFLTAFALYYAWFSWG